MGGANGVLEAGGYFRMLTARAMTSTPTRSATPDWTAIVHFDHRASGITSVGLKAVAFVKDKYR
jgi:hypothetical protein